MGWMNLFGIYDFHGNFLSSKGYFLQKIPAATRRSQPGGEMFL